MSREKEGEAEEEQERQVEGPRSGQFCYSVAYCDVISRVILRENSALKNQLADSTRTDRPDDRRVLSSHSLLSKHSILHLQPPPLLRPSPTSLPKLFPSPPPNPSVSLPLYTLLPPSLFPLLFFLSSSSALFAFLLDLSIACSPPPPLASPFLIACMHPFVAGTPFSRQRDGIDANCGVRTEAEEPSTLPRAVLSTQDNSKRKRNSNSILGTRSRQGEGGWRVGKGHRRAMGRHASVPTREANRSERERRWGRGRQRRRASHRERGCKGPREDIRTTITWASEAQRRFPAGRD